MRCPHTRGGEPQAGQKRTVMNAFADEYGVELMRNLVGLEPSTYYYQYQPVRADDLAVRTMTQDVAHASHATATCGCTRS